MFHIPYHFCLIDPGGIYDTEYVFFILLLRPDVIQGLFLARFRDNFTIGNDLLYAFVIV